MPARARLPELQALPIARFALSGQAVELQPPRTEHRNAPNTLDHGIKLLALRMSAAVVAVAH